MDIIIFILIIILGLWTNSYFVSTVGGTPLAVIKQYIENQKNV